MQIKINKTNLMEKKKDITLPSNWRSINVAEVRYWLDRAKEKGGKPLKFATWTYEQCDEVEKAQLKAAKNGDFSEDVFFTEFETLLNTIDEPGASTKKSKKEPARAEIYATSGKLAKDGDYYVRGLKNSDIVKKAKNILKKYSSISSVTKSNGDEETIIFSLPSTIYESLNPKKYIKENYIKEDVEPSIEEIKSLISTAEEIKEDIENVLIRLNTFTMKLRNNSYHRLASNMKSYMVSYLTNIVEGDNGGMDSLNDVIEELSEDI